MQSIIILNNFFTIWNALIVFAFLLIVGLLILFLKKKIKELNEINEELFKANEKKNNLLGIAAHDLRNPISIINSFSELILAQHSKDLDPHIWQIIGYIHEISNNTLILLKNLLDISVIESGKINIELKMQDYLEFLRKNIYLNQILAEKKEITIKLLTNEKDIKLKFDEHYLSEVINNLLSNAIKYSFSKNEILIQVTRTDKNSVLTEIIDKGKGIPKNEQNKLFNYFQKTSTQPTNGEKSTGLGLAIARKIIQEHHGQIGVKSNIGIGSNFYFELF